MSPLDIKLLRDFRRLWSQGLAIALVASAGVMTLVLGIGAFRALSETQAAYYDRYSFAEIFAAATRAPNRVLERIGDIPGVAAVDGRIQQTAILDIQGLDEPATGLLLSIPNVGEPRLNRLFYLEGGAPEPDRGEVVISGAFAEANGLGPGDTFSAIMGGQKRTLTISGVALSPEFIYSVAPGEIFPDDERFGIIWLRYSDAATAYDLAGAFNSVTLQLTRGAVTLSVIDELDDILKPYGGAGAYDRTTQISHAFLDSELVQLEAMSYFLPPIFLGVAAFLVNMTLARLISLEREQIGLLKALGYHSWTIAWHYMKLALLIGGVGVLVGWVIGAWAGRGMAALYAEFYRFPFLFFQDRPDVYAISGFAAISAAALGSLLAVRSTLSLSAAVAMAPPAPPVYRRFFLDKLGVTRRLPQSLTMAARNMWRRPLRAMLSLTGITLSTGLLVSGLSTEDSLEYMIEASYFLADRQHASLSFARPLDPGGMEEVRRLPGVVSAEPFRSVPVEITNGLHKKRVGLTGKTTDADLSRIIDLELEPVALPEGGLALSETLAEILDVRIGDVVDLELLDGTGKTLSLSVSQVIQQFIGLGAYMDIRALNRALDEAELASGANLALDESRADDLYTQVKLTPAIAGITLQRQSLATLRETIGENIGLSRAIYVILAVVIVFGVVYNSMRIQLSERARELASLRVLGFTKLEVSEILLTELVIITAVAIPLGWLVGYGMAYGIFENIQSELFSFPLVVGRQTYAWGAIIVLIATVMSAYVVQRRVAQLDLIEVLKTRE